MVRSFLPILATASVLIFPACSNYVAEPVSEERMAYPDSPQSQQIDEYHGVRVTDPYRWLENMHSTEVKDWVEFKVLDVRTGTVTADHIAGTKFTNISWLPDETGFYYSRYPEGEDGVADDQQTVRIYFYRIGEAQANDELIYQLAGERPINPYPQVAANGRFLLANLSEGFSQTAFMLSI